MSKKKNIMQRSDIPYAERIQLQKRAEIRAHRDEAARIALQVSCVALNDTEGLGYQRLTRFAKRVAELIDEYYEDPEVQDYHLQQRLEQMGFIIENGHMFAAERASTGEIVPTKLLAERKDKSD